MLSKKIHIGFWHYYDFVNKPQWFSSTRCCKMTAEILSLAEPCNIYVMRCAIWYHLHNFKNVKNTHGGVLTLVKLQASVWYTHDALQSFRETEKNGDGSIVTDISKISTFRNGVTLAIFNASGKTLFSNDFSNRYLMGSFNTLKQFSL